MFKKILVALDGSQKSDRAFDFALDLAEKYSAEILIFSVVPLIPSIISAVYPGSDKYYAASKARHEQVLQDTLKKAKNLQPNLNILTKLAEGRPANKILETAKLKKSDLIIVGDRGLGGIQEFILGSVSHRVADGATCPVLIVK
ncbi:MAG: universal stress protein [Candidatus Heimdallarchaeota archaeon]